MKRLAWRWSALALLATWLLALLPPAAVALYAFSTRWDRSLLPEGATLVTGGVGRPQGLEQGYYVKPTVFANANNSMRIAREEIFGPVLTIIGYDSLDEALDVIARFRPQQAYLTHMCHEIEHEEVDRRLPANDESRGGDRKTS